jgi:hypothetical protein
MSVLLQPFAKIQSRSNTALRFYHADCLEVFAQLPPHSVDVIVTSPPYNLGIEYGAYQDTLSRPDYLQWTNAWVAAAARVLKAEGSLFLNVGAKPSDPWTALDVAQVVRSHLRLQNIIHWVKSIAIEQRLAGTAAGLARDLAVGHYKPINSTRYLNDCHEFVFHFTPLGATSLDRLALGVPYQDASNVGAVRPAASDAAGTPGSSRMKPFSGGIATARTRRRFPPGCPSNVCGCMGWGAPVSSWIPLRDSAALPLPARAWDSISSAPMSTRRISNSP